MLRRGDAGSVLLLFPAAFMAVLVLGAIAIDLGLVQVRARELGLAASAAADDTLAALDITELRATGRLRLDGPRAETVARTTLARSAPPGTRLTALEIVSAPDGRPLVTLTACVDVDLVVAPALPGVAGTRTVCRTARTIVR